MLNKNRQAGILPPLGPKMGAKEDAMHPLEQVKRLLKTSSVD